MIYDALHAEHLIEVRSISPTIVVEMLYATDKNIAGVPIYTSTDCFLRPSVVHALHKVQKELVHKGLGLKIWDGYRPITVQQKLWEALADVYPNEKERECYVANPQSGGRHTRGTAVDCTLITLHDGKEVEMPTAFDHFGPESWRSYDGPKLTATAKENRAFLEILMSAHGFEGLPSEWWHFDLKGWQEYGVLESKT